MRRKWLIIVLVLLAAGAVVVWQRGRPEAVVEVVHPRRATIRAYVEEQAVTELPHTYLVAMPIAGWLERIDLREGDAVKKGQVVARLETADLEDQVLQGQQRIARLEAEIQKTADNRLENNMLVQAQAIVKAMDDTVEAAKRTVEASKAVADFAKTEVDRLRKLGESHAASDVEIRQAETNWRRSEAENQRDALQLAALRTLAAVSYIGPKSILDYIDRKSFDKESLQRQLDAAKAELEMEKRNLARATIESPIDGVVLNRHETRRQFLSAGTPLLTLGRLEDMEVIAEVLTERAMRISPGDPVEIYGEGIASGPLTGKVLRVYPAGFKKISSLGVEQQRVDVAVQLERRPERLGVDFRVHVRIFYDQASDVPTLPRTALFRGPDGGWRAMVVRDGVVAVAPVKVGLMNDDDAQIVEGLTIDDAVVAQPSTDITAGMRVEVAPRGA
jgi:HlyD family secretion protein